jgi:uncharacterized protein (TIGR03545 family)
MSKKIPSIFKKPIPEKKFEKHYARLLEQPADKEFLYNIFELKDSFYTLKEDPENETDKKRLKKLNSLAKDIKANRALPVKIIPLALTGVLAAGLVLLFTVLLNPILENVIERGLENVFEARVDINGFNLSLIRFNISFNSLTIANRDKPMTNLVQMDRAVIKLLPNAVLRGKIYIEQIRADALQFGTERTISGALPKIAASKPEPVPVAAKQTESTTPPLVDFQNFDAAALLEREYDKLQSVKVYNDLTDFYNSSVEDWTDRADDVKKKADGLRERGQTLLNFNIAGLDIKNPADIKKVTDFIRDGKTMVDEVKSAVNTANDIVNKIQDDVNTANNIQKAARDSVSEDIKHLRSYFDFSGGGYHQLLDPVIEEVLSTEAKIYIDYGMLALGVLEKIKNAAGSINTEKKVEEKKPVYKGRDVIYPSRLYPKFYLGVLASDWTIQKTHWAFDLRDVSSNPEITAKPVSLKIDFNETEGSKRYINFSGRADMRSSVNELFFADISGGNIPLNFKNDFEALGISGFTGNTTVTVHAGGTRDGGITAGASSVITNARLEDPGNSIAIALAQAFGEVSAVNVSALYTQEGGVSDFDIETNIGDIILSALRKAMAEYAEKGIALLEKQLREKLTPLIAKANISQEDLNSLLALAKGDRSALTNLQSSLQNKIDEAEKKARGTVDEIKAQAQEKAQEKVDEIKTQAQEKAKDAIGGALRKLW